MASTKLDNLSGEGLTERVVAVYRDFDLSIKNLHADSKGYFSKTLGIFKSVSETLLDKRKTLDISTELISEELRLSHNIMGEIISIVQFEDILCQKLEHISAINHKVINYLVSNRKMDGDDIALIAKLFQLHHAQLRYTKVEEKEVSIEFGSKLREVDHLLVRMLLKLEAQDREKAELLIGTIQKIDLSIKLIQSFIESQIDTFCEKADACLEILKALEIKEVHSANEKPVGFDLQEIIKLYTIESERRVFYSVFECMEENEVFEQTAANKNAGNIDLF